MKNPSVSVVIPAYNEETTLKALFDQTLQVLNSCCEDYEIILCDDASTDTTRGILESLGAGDARVKKIYHPVNQGLFATFAELYASAGKDYVLLLPGDGQWSPDFLKDALTKIDAYDVVIAVRQNKQYTLGRKINSWVFNRLVQLLFGVNLYDIGSVKLVRREIYQKINVSTQSAFTEAERLLKARKSGYRIGMIPCRHLARQKGEGRGATPDKIFQALGDMIRFRLIY